MPSGKEERISAAADRSAPAPKKRFVLWALLLGLAVLVLIACLPGILRTLETRAGERAAEAQQRAAAAQYQSGLDLIAQADYAAALETLQPLAASNKHARTLCFYCRARLCYDPSVPATASAALDKLFYDYTYNGEYSAEIAAFYQKLTDAVNEDLIRQQKANGWPYIGMPAAEVETTLLGSALRIHTFADGANYLFVQDNGRYIVATCRGGSVVRVDDYDYAALNGFYGCIFDLPDPDSATDSGTGSGADNSAGSDVTLPPASGGSSSGGSSSAGSSSSAGVKDPYGAKDYLFPEDFYEDHFDDFSDFEDAEDYWYAHR